MRDFRVGLIGYGFSGRTFHTPLIRSVAGLSLASVSTSRIADVRHELAGITLERDPAQLLKDDSLDLIVVASPNDTHEQWVRAALDTGKHVVVDKPFTLDSKAARSLCDLAARKGKLLAVFHNRRWDSDYLSVKRVIESGTLGRIAHFESHFDRFRPTVRQRWREGSGPGAGIWYDLAPHLIDQALQLFGLPTAVTATLARLREDALADDWAHGVLHYPRMQVLLHASMLVAGGSPRFLVHGDQGSLIKRLADRQESQLLAGEKPGGPDWGHDPDDATRWDATGVEHREPSPRGDQSRFYIDIVAALRGNAENPTPPHQVLGVMAVLEAGIHSSQVGKTVEPDLTAEEIAAWN